MSIPSTTWFTSDPHFGHRFVSQIRGFETVEEHDTAVLESYTALIRPNDHTFWLGDLAVSNPEAALAAIASIPGHHHVVWGNHDKGHPMHRTSNRLQADYLKVFESAQAFLYRRINGTPVLLSHFPYEGDTGGRDEERYTQYRLRDEGLPIVHGHTHSTSRLSTSTRGTTQVHVGWDAWRSPVPMDTVHAMLTMAAA